MLSVVTIPYKFQLIFHFIRNFLTLFNLYMEVDHRSYRRNFCSCEKKALKNSGLYGTRTLDLCYTGAVHRCITVCVSQRSRVRILYMPEFFSGFLLATAKVASITAMINFHVIHNFAF